MRQEKGGIDNLFQALLQIYDEMIQKMTDKLRLILEVDNWRNPNTSIRGNEEDGAGTQDSNEDSTRKGGTRDRAAAETRGYYEIQGGTEAGLGGEGGSGKGKVTARTGQIWERDWRERGETSNCSVGNEDRIR